MLTAEEMRLLLDSIDTAKLIGVRDRAMIALMGYTFARVGAVIQMKVEDYYIQNRRGWVRLHEKGGKVNELPCHHNLEESLEGGFRRRVFPQAQRSPLPDDAERKAHGPPADGASRGLPNDPPSRVLGGHRNGDFCHNFRATGITVYLQNGGKLEVAQQMAGTNPRALPASTNRRNDAVALDVIERVLF